MKSLLPLLLLALSACVTRPGASAPVEVKIIAFNDLHGNLEPPNQSIEVAPGERVAAGGAAQLAAAIGALKSQNPNHVVVSAGDMIGASPLISALFLDEPTIHAADAFGLDFNAVGNHEFDRGRAELLRMKRGGCAKHTERMPCAVEPFAGARATFLAANTVTESGETLFPPYEVRRFGRVQIAFIGLTLKGTAQVVTPAGVAGLDFRDEAATVNALVPKLRAEGADAVVVLIHQGAATKAAYNAKTCDGLEGELMPILAGLDPKVDLVVSGHTHRAYICDYGAIDPARRFLVTSAGQYGTLLTDITLTIDPRAGDVTGKRADNVIIRSDGPADAKVAAIVARYKAASREASARVVGRLSGEALRKQTPSRESVLGNLIADAQLAATSSSGAQIAFMNPGGVRADLVPTNGAVSFGDLFAVQPFGNTLIVKSFIGAQVRALLEQQFSFAEPRVLLPSRGLTYAYDASKPAGARISDLRLNGQTIRDDATYRITMNSFLSSGGDGFTVFTQGTNQQGGPLDLDALEAYLRGGAVTPPATGRIINRSPP